LPTPEEWQREVDDALFGTDEAESWRREGEAPKDLFGEADSGVTVEPVGEHVGYQPASSSGSQAPRAVSVDELDAALFGSAAASARAAPPAPGPAGASSFADPDEETIIAELADDADAAEPAGPGRGGRRVWVLAGCTALVVIIGATAGALIAGRSGSTGPGRKTVSDHTTATTATSAPVVTTTPVPATTAPAVTAPPAAPTTARIPATTRRTVPPRASPSVEPAPLPPAPPPTEPPPSTSPPSTTPPSTGLLQ
jgi:hypothetical protein